MVVPRVRVEKNNWWDAGKYGRIKLRRRVNLSFQLDIVETIRSQKEFIVSLFEYKLTVVLRGNCSVYQDA